MRVMKLQQPAIVSSVFIRLYSLPLPAQILAQPLAKMFWFYGKLLLQQSFETHGLIISVAGSGRSVRLDEAAPFSGSLISSSSQKLLNYSAILNSLHGGTDWDGNNKSLVRVGHWTDKHPFLLFRFSPWLTETVSLSKVFNKYNSGSRELILVFWVPLQTQLGKPALRAKSHLWLVLLVSLSAHCKVFP